MAAIMITPVFLLINVYLLARTLKWLKSLHPALGKRCFRTVFLVLYLLLSTTALTSFLFQRPLWLHRILKPVSNLFLGYFLYAILFVLAADLIALILRRSHHRSFLSLKRAGILILCLVLLTGTYGYFHERTLYTKEYQVTVDKPLNSEGSLRIVLASDLHLGYSIGTYHVEHLVNRINELDADLVLFAGDTFDNEFEAIQDPDTISRLLSQIQSTYGSFACFGNHDMDEPLLGGFSVGKASDSDDSRMLQFFQDSNIRLLNDEAILIDNSFYLVGRKDLGRSEKIEGGRLSPEELLAPLDKEKTILVLDHEPDELSSLAKAGADLDLSGHTHNGQIFPGNLLIGLFWENPYGVQEMDGMTSVVTSGVGVWGPNMRVGTNSEVVLLTVQFQET